MNDNAEPDFLQFVRDPANGFVDALVPSSSSIAGQLQRKSKRILHAAGSLKRGITPAQARADLEVLLENNRRRFPQFYRKDNQWGFLSVIKKDRICMT